MEKELYKNKYADRREVKAKITSIVVKNGVVEEVVDNWEHALSYRVVNNSMGFASTNHPGSQGIWRNAVKLSKTGTCKRNLSEEKIVKDEKKIKCKFNPRDIPVEEKIKITLQIDKELRVSDKISTTDVLYHDAWVEKGFENTEGTSIIQKYPLVAIHATAVSREGGMIQRAVEGFAGHFGLERISSFKPEKIGIRAVEMLKSETIKGGKYDVVVDGKMAGVLAHEAVGHACEADSVLDGDSILEGMLGKRIGNRIVSIADDATKTSWKGGYFYDDEGVKGQKKYLVKEGVLAGYLHSRETGFQMNSKSTGNYRGDVLHLPLVRMSNTYFEKGEHTKEELFEISKGIYLGGMLGGAVITKTGEFIFTAEEGFLIEKGEKTKRLRNLMLVGNILQTLKQIDGIGRDFLTSPGTCGKQGKPCPVADGGPHLRIRKIFVSGK